MKIGVFVTAGHPGSDRAYLDAAGRAAESLGFDSLWVAEHVVLFDQYESRYPYAEDGRIPVRRDAGLIAPFTALSFLAAITTRIRLGTGICLVPQRNPLYTAREAADVDWLSGGRLDLGVGVGWLAEEFQALGVPFARRGERCRSYLEVMKRLWCDDVSQYEDEFYTLPACRQFPKPLQKPHPPIHFGGESDVALRRVADIGQGWYGFNLDPPQAARSIEGLRAAAQKHERPEALGRLEITITPPPMGPVDLDLMRRYHDIGVDRVVPYLIAGSPDDLVGQVEGIAAQIIGKI